MHASALQQALELRERPYCAVAAWGVVRAMVRELGIVGVAVVQAMRCGEITAGAVFNEFVAPVQESFVELRALYGDVEYAYGNDPCGPPLQAVAAAATLILRVTRVWENAAASGWLHADVVTLLGDVGLAATLQSPGTGALGAQG
jgi:hypothetical protein